ncbi:AraC family transcriptional regulator [Methylocapsa sp. S129]|uniref:helix-turn-helix transcriptional regulator n=1 Tax=Methylocapsa sp. S129 TaxID=1641869 RepID=UPI00131AFE18|nr:AraC family transcriptional regulator [Methylocapsa sp. S129]
MNDPATEHFSTDAFPERERFDAWRELIGRNLQRSETERLSDLPFSAKATVRSLPGLRIHKETRTPLRVARTREFLADGHDSLVLALSTAAGHASWPGGEVAFGPGEPVILASRELSVCAHLLPSDGVYLCAPRAALRPLLRDVDAVPMGRLRENTAALSLLKHYVEALQDDGQLTATPELQHLAVRHIHDLLALTLGATRDATQIAQGGGLRAARLSAIKAYILGSLPRGDLTVAAVARRHRVSPRYVQLLFESEGTTFSDFVRRRRLACAHRMLSDVRCADLSIGQIAYEAGFGDLSHFNHAFRKLYGLSPSQARAEARYPR